MNVIFEAILEFFVESLFFVKYIIFGGIFVILAILQLVNIFT